VDGRGKEHTLIQCQSCGHIYVINKKISIEKSIINSVCPRCGGHVGLNCGDTEDDLYIYMNPNLDERYFNY
jgi:transcription elongation factor Elf1